MAKKTEATEERQEIVTTTGGVPAHLAALAGEYSPNAGMEEIGVTDLKRPFYRILQPTSKEVAPGQDKYLEEARVGQIIEGAISRELFTELIMVPLKVIKGWSEFKDQKQGGGFLGFHHEDSDRVQNAADQDYCTKVTPEGTLLKHTFQLFFLVDPVRIGKPVLGIMGFTGGALSDVKKFLSYTMSLGQPLFFKQYKVTTYPKINTNHNSTTFRPHFNVDKSEFVTREIATAAGEIQKELDSAQLKAMLDASVEEPGEEVDSEVADTVNESMS